uniref:Solute carrier family 22 member 13a n=1 Tax=Hippocampus comes TaxID=109280 RepID=A0A3Q2Y9C6_HIPCM
MTTFGDILQNIGEFGIFQKLIICALSFPNMILGFEFACVFFIQSDPERHCNTDWILEADSNLTSDEQLNLTVPRERDGSFSRCRMFVPVNWDIGTIRERGLNETAACQNGWVYSNSLYTATIVTDVSDDSQIPLVVALIFTVTTALCPNYLLYLISQFLMGLGYGGFRCLANIMNPLCFSVLTATEWIGASKRSWGVAATQLCGAVGQAVLAGLIYVVRDWRVAQLITAALLGVIVVYIWFLPESARWLLERGRTEEAKELLFKVASINKRRFSETLLEKVLRLWLQTLTFLGVKNLGDSFHLNVAYYCISFNVGNFGLDVFLTQLIFGVTEIPVHLVCVWLLEALGRRVSFISTLLVGGVLLMSSDSSENRDWTFVRLNSCFSGFRQTASGVGSIASRAGGLIAPLVNMLAMYHWSIPVISFSGLTLLSGGLCFILPETRGKELPDSFDEAESNRSTISRKYDPIAIDRCYVHACYLLTTKLYSLSRDLNGLHNNDVLQSLMLVSFLFFFCRSKKATKKESDSNVIHIKSSKL